MTRSIPNHFARGPVANVLAALAVLLLAMAGGSAQAQPLAAKGQTATIQASGLDDKPFDMARLKNKVVMVFY